MSGAVLSMIALLVLLSGKNIDTNDRMFLNSPFRPAEAYRSFKIPVHFNDSIPDDTLTLYFSEADLPVAFSRNISTAVCFDSLCRRANITLYWEVFGKYIGYSIPRGDELTKKEHVPFSDSDYARLNEVLSDSLSALKYFTLDKIIPVKQSVGKADAISGATIPNLGPWIVPDAAYTSFTLWKITYGATRDSIVAYTQKNLLSNKLIYNILQNGDPYNQIKALQWISEANIPYDQFIEPALNILHSGNFYTLRQALKFLKKCTLSTEFLQIEMIKLFKDEDFKIKNAVIEYISSTDKLTKPVAVEMFRLLKNDDYYLVNVVLTLLTKRYQPDYADQLYLSRLLKSKNKNVSNRVYSYLNNIPDQARDIARLLDRYRKNNF
jgi:hypothetical protein